MMNRLPASVRLGPILAIGLFGVAVAGPMEIAREAWRRGDDATVLRVLRPLAERGDARAQTNLGLLYADPAPLQDVALARDWLGKAAGQGNAYAQAMLGAMFALGGGGPPNPTLALFWWRKAADQGSAAAETSLAELYARGLGVKQDSVQALAWFQKAADQGYAPAEMNLGVMFETGQGAARDDALALSWFRKAADQGNPQAQYRLGDMYNVGLGAPKDDAKAAFWFLKAAGQGDARTTYRATCGSTSPPRISPRVKPSIGTRWRICATPSAAG